MAAAEQDTIAAIMTATGRGSVAGLRLSGPSAFAIASRLLPKGGELADFAPRRSHLTWLCDLSGNRLDQVMIVRYPAPHSYTGEDVVEIFCHGGTLVPHLILEQLCAAGCRLAEPGEFTKRAVLNHKLDLIQAEAVAEIIAAESPAYLQNVLSHLEGAFSSQVRALRQRLLHTCALLELGLDFSEEDVEFADRAQLQAELAQLDLMIARLLAGFERGQALKEGWKLAIIGKPNVGKSSLMNALLRHERVIVSPIPGTTRDTVEERIRLGGHLFRLIDTAGIRQHGDALEQIGMTRSRRAVQAADIIVFVTDGSGAADREDEAIAEICRARAATGSLLGILHVSNKADLPDSPHAFQFQAAEVARIKTSATTGHGIAELENALVELVTAKASANREETGYVNLRQRLCLEKARTALHAAAQSLHDNLSAEFVAVDLREVIFQLGALIGEVTNEDILGEIFANFCIGK
ncbi:MAG: tRNA uridine-5-carboxymethylaminomethyl(34) synthesis GTPase MnmE [candidate division KSB1 bacterium]|nr:tRNA uridine-5-carboxymethylaminomethyl(34) synthesis GTPase MnmE [candidate division KSB1 bacterium]MDZ7274353.1 tRNA uridine-5-carboxymethylaminomethyl(34) synthesis GTPase MnmE [candidate division KSB1 bacterium]MDZ7284985.1 tRNA uridine-5-carboxymethylaminomethyl(34) synthesis GTPase MnmE [candidate division KSB1 bacterium]MDZ7297594.1 tRNA uridine-5-carboxymethylaminomethyl(34) synthesis GTPase MnmE [candidate division KSB1 bacterium]MDZ7308658.1 tRNA uridine-5-carboxymethylaminomethyl(